MPACGRYSSQHWSGLRHQLISVSIVVLHAEGRRMGLVVYKIHDTQEIVVKPLARQLNGLACYVGATIMGDGLAALILDVVGLARLEDRNRPQARSADDSDVSLDVPTISGVAPSTLWMPGLT